MKTNWYKDLLEIDKEAGIILITVETNILYHEFDSTKVVRRSGSLEDVKELINYDFDSGYGGVEGFSFTAWTKDRIYFPAQYDGSEWIASVPRNPCDEVTYHIGGG